MTNDIHNDPQIAEFVTKIIDMAPEAPMYPDTVVASVPSPRRKVVPWIWAPVAAVAVLLVVAPIAMRGGDGDEASGLPIGSDQAVADTPVSDASTDPIVGPDPVVPSVDSERNTLSLAPVVVAPGGNVVIDFTGDNNAVRSELFWMDRFDYGESQWFADWILWSDRADGGPRSARASSTSVIVPPLGITVPGTDTLLVPTDLPLGTYRVCVGVTDGACGVFEISDEVVPSSGGGLDPTELPPPDAQDATRPAFGQVEFGSNGTVLIVRPAQWLTGPDAVILAREDGFIGPQEDLPNPFYLRMDREVGVIEFEIGPEFRATVLGGEDGTTAVVLTAVEWASWLEASDWLVEPLIDDIGGAFVHLTYDNQGRVMTVVHQYVP